MKFTGSTNVLLNLVLILIIVFLLKTLITVPKNVYANPAATYDVRISSFDKLEDLLNKASAEGWKLHSYAISGNFHFVILEREAI